MSHVIDLLAHTVLGVELGPLPEYQKVVLSPVFNGIGTVELHYPQGGENFDLLEQNDELLVHVWIDGQRKLDLDFILEEMDGDDVEYVDGQAIIKYQGRFLLKRLEEAIVYPWPWPITFAEPQITRNPEAKPPRGGFSADDPRIPTQSPRGGVKIEWYDSPIDGMAEVRYADNSLWDLRASGPNGEFVGTWHMSEEKGKGEHAFVNATPGTIFRTLINRAHGRGTLQGFESFNDIKWNSAVDSKGANWAKRISITFSAGTTYLQVLDALVDNQVCEWERRQGGIRLYNWGTLGTDRSTGSNPVVFRVGRDVSEAPRKRTVRGTSTALLAAGGAGVYVEQTDASTEARRLRRIESYASEGNIKDEGTLRAFAESKLPTLTETRLEQTVGLDLNDKDVNNFPTVHFDAGDWVGADLGGRVFQRVRVMQWVLEFNSDGTTTGSVVLNDLVDENISKLNNRISRILSGAAVTGTSVAVTDVPRDIVDNMAPAIPAGLSLSSSAYLDPQGTPFAQISASWQAVTDNADGTATNDVDQYLIRWRRVRPDLDPDPWSPVAPVEDTFASWSPVPVKTYIEAQVGARDRMGNFSGWSGSAQVMTASDTTPPPTPSGPTVKNYLGVLVVTWDGKGRFGEAMPPDFNRIEVHISNVNSFTPSSATYKDHLTSAGSVVFTTPYGESTYVRFVSVDDSGNRSVYSTQNVGKTQKVVGDDIFSGAVGSVQLASAAIKSIHIDTAAINSVHVGEINVGKLTGGILNATVTVSGLIRSSADYPRSEMSSLGFRMYDRNGVQTLRTHTTTGRVEITGRISADILTSYGRANNNGGWIEMGRLSADNDPSDELRFIVGESAVNIRNTFGRPGALIISTRTTATAAAVQHTISDYGYEIPIGFNYMSSGSAVIMEQNHVGLRFPLSGQKIASRSGGTRMGMSFPPPNGIGGVLLYWNQQNVALKGYNGYLEVRTGNDGGFQPMKARGYDVISDPSTKTDNQEITAEMIEQCKTAHPKMYRNAEGGPLRVGFMADELPGVLVTNKASDGAMSVDLYGLVALLFAEMRTEIAELKQQIPVPPLAK